MPYSVNVDLSGSILDDFLESKSRVKQTGQELRGTLSDTIIVLLFIWRNNLG